MSDEQEPAEGSSAIDNIVNAGAAKALAQLDGDIPPVVAEPEPVVAEPVAESKQEERPRDDKGKFAPKSAEAPIKLPSGEYTLAQLEAIAAGKPAIEAMAQNVREQVEGLKSEAARVRSEAAAVKAEKAEAARMREENEQLRALLLEADQNGGVIDPREMLRRGHKAPAKPAAELTEEEFERRVTDTVERKLTERTRAQRQERLEGDYNSWVKSALESNPTLKSRAPQYGWHVTGSLRQKFIENKIDPSTVSDAQYQAYIRAEVAELAALEERLRAEELGATLDAHANGKKDLPVSPKNAGTAIPQKPQSMTFDFKKNFMEHGIDGGFDRMAADLQTKMDDLDRIAGR